MTQLIIIIIIIRGVYLPLLWEGPGVVYPCDSYPHLKNPLVLGFDCELVHDYHMIVT